MILCRIKPAWMGWFSGQRRLVREMTTSMIRSGHDNPLGMPQTSRIARTKSRIPHCKKVIVVYSNKGGVGKSTVASNLAVALQRSNAGRVGLLDLDIFGPSIAKMMGLENIGEPDLSAQGKLLPMSNHSISCMSMAFLTKNTAETSSAPVVWRGMMVQKAAQQLIFDVDWRDRASEEELDFLVIDMPPGTGDVALTLGQLVEVDAAVIVTTPQAVSSIDTWKGVNLFNKLGVPVLGVVLNMAYFVCSSCSLSHYIFGDLEKVYHAADQAHVRILCELPMDSNVSAAGDSGRPSLFESGPGTSNDFNKSFGKIVHAITETT